ncbi:aminopeptidase N [Corynebacterium choanae]|nr:aminopeptidase N [Corynebacterium choanae]
MTSTNLTRTEAQQRAALIDEVHYDLVLDLTTGPKTFQSTTTITFTAKDAGSTFVDLRAAAINTVTLDGTDITAAAVPTTDAGDYDETQGVLLADLTAGKHTLVVAADCVYSRTGQGLHRYVDPADDRVYLYTQFETADAKRMFACFDQPDIKATYELTITTDTGVKVIGNAEQTVTEKDGKLVHTSTIDYQLSTYLVAICVGDYYEVRDQWQGKLTHYPQTPAGQPEELTIPLGLYCRQSLAKHLDAERLFTETKQGFDFYHANFGYAYPFGKYDQTFVPEFNMGAMENAGCVTHRDEYVFTSTPTRAVLERRCDTVLHEMAHMWFGDLVTMRWWDDLWLNESFATWAATISQAEATEYDTAWVTFANKHKAWAYEQDQLPSTHPISADAGDIETVEQNFDGITYAKGASVLKQLQAYVGREAFFAGVRQHFAHHAFGNATFADLLESLEQASGRDLSDWAKQWLQTTGITPLAATVDVDDNDRISKLTITQRGAAPGAGEQRDHRVAVGLYKTDDNGDVVRYRQVHVDVTGESQTVDELVGEAAPQLVLVNDDDLTYCMMELDDASTSFVADHLGRIVDPMARALCWSALWEQVRNGEMAARNYLAIVAEHLPQETESSVIERVIMNSGIALNRYADPQWVADTGNELIGNVMVTLLKQAEAGSDTQLVVTKGITGLPVSDATAPIVGALAKGEAPVAGVTMDHGLQWLGLISAISGNRIADPASTIAALREEDNTSQGHLNALEAAAAVPTQQAKREIFEEITNNTGDLSNLTIRHKLMGYNHAGSHSITNTIGMDYFDRVTTVWKNLTPEMALVTATGLYPTALTTDEAFAAADALINDESLPHGLRRVLAERRDVAARGKRLQAIDAQAATA